MRRGDVTGSYPAHLGPINPKYGGSFEIGPTDPEAIDDVAQNAGPEDQVLAPEDLTPEPDND